MLCLVVSCRVFVQNILYSTVCVPRGGSFLFNKTMNTVDSSNFLSSIPVRVCQTCGIAKSLDHFVSMYTEASTSNCDLCRQKQREVYRRSVLSEKMTSRKAAEEEAV